MSHTDSSRPGATSDHTAVAPDQGRATTLSAVGKWAPVYLRLALATAFLSSVADRFGSFGSAGHESWYGTAAWGSFADFVDYEKTVQSFLPESSAYTLSVLATVGEAACGLALLLGLAIRVASYLAGVLLLVFAVSMALSFGLHEPMSYSVFTASAGAFCLASSASLWHQPFSIDALLTRRATRRSASRISG